MLALPDDFTPGFAVPDELPQAAHWFVFSGNLLLVSTTALIPRGFAWPFPELTPLRTLYMGVHRQSPCIAVEIAREPPSPLPADTALYGLRDLWGWMDEALVGLAGQAIQLIDWDRCHRFCGRCGRETKPRLDERARHCPGCGLSCYPRIAPAVMVRIVNPQDGTLLLARSPRFPPGRYSVLAGFVDPGESLEQAAHREVMEEVGLKIANLHYFSSQSWPFPHSLMLAFTADYVAGEIDFDGVEIDDAGWFSPDNLPELPPPISIARRLIDDYLAAGR